MEETPNTLNYMYLGFTVFTLVMGIYVYSFYARWKNLRLQETSLQELNK
ncbi:MAG TPA: hypothetical protein VN226_10640 [Anaerolineales bacterium]|nr:hypothetical protein [Anaerolineales bacterium]